MLERLTIDKETTTRKWKWCTAEVYDRKKRTKWDIVRRCGRSRETIVTVLKSRYHPRWIQIVFCMTRVAGSEIHFEPARIGSNWFSEKSAGSKLLPVKDEFGWILDSLVTSNLVYFNRTCWIKNSYSQKLYSYYELKPSNQDDAKDIARKNTYDVWRETLRRKKATTTRRKTGQEENFHEEKWMRNGVRVPMHTVFVQPENNTLRSRGFLQPTEIRILFDIFFVLRVRVQIP